MVTTTDQNTLLRLILLAEPTNEEAARYARPDDFKETGDDLKRTVICSARLDDQRWEDRHGSSIYLYGSPSYIDDQRTEDYLSDLGEPRLTFIMVDNMKSIIITLMLSELRTKQTKLRESERNVCFIEKGAVNCKKGSHLHDVGLSFRRKHTIRG